MGAGCRTLLVGAAVAVQALACVAGSGGSVTVTGAWVRPTVDTSTPTAVYLTISNTTAADDTLLGVSSSAAQSVEIHQTSSDMPGMSGMTGMTPVASVVIPSGGVVRFTPGGLHLMLVGLRAPLVAGGSVTLHLEFQRAGRVDADAIVRTG